ncbi:MULTISPECIES: YaaR family protein [Bacillus]|jgi:uncharacterized protein|uniref:DUF327 domain-containing protein n=1 Tax=Bacillus smithii 7_3_47FAA TaxID=665952 RepID=G9QGQ4_9BACI|nr:YaaR family protein [Bacillus smithii]EHL79717.1 hypothetical protein HMPREF1015_02818 [Bacillus smithii 7_3_47FAA]
MKINQDLRIGAENFRGDIKRTPAVHGQFSNLVQQYDQKLKDEQLKQLMANIDEAGERLAKSRNLQDLVKYKTLIKKFIKETVDYGMELSSSHSWNLYGEGRQLKVVKTIDEKLVELAEDLVNKEKLTIDILGKIGEIKGLLINLYA